MVTKFGKTKKKGWKKREKGEGGEKRTENGAERGDGSMNGTGVIHTTAHLATWKSRRRGAWLKVWPTPSVDLDMTPTDGAAPREIETPR